MTAPGPFGLVVVGGGAAGLLAALTAGEALRAGGLWAPIRLFEAAREPGRKILVSGGGRCNVLPMVDVPERFVSESPGRLVRRSLDRFPLAEQRTFFEELLGGPLREEPETRKLFPPSNRAKDVREALVRRCVTAGVEVVPNAACSALTTRAGGGFDVVVGGKSVRADAVILATGGRSVLPAGADARGFDLAAELGHTVRALYPALAPLVADPAVHAALSGVSLPVTVTASSTSERVQATGGFLFTHRGYSGPAVLDVSHVVERAKRAGGDGTFTVTVALTPSGDLPTGAGTVLGQLKRLLPERLAEVVRVQAGVPDGPLAQLTRDARRALASALQAFPLPVTGTEGYRTAEVTGGGVALEEIDPGSGESRRVPGLFLAGEILDAFGPIGGFNFQWAWATGRSAGLGAARRLLGDRSGGEISESKNT